MYAYACVCAGPLQTLEKATTDLPKIHFGTPKLRVFCIFRLLIFPSKNVPKNAKREPALFRVM